MRRSVRVGLYWLLGFLVGSLILGTYKGNPFVDNVVYGLWTGALAGVAAAAVIEIMQRRSR